MSGRMARGCFFAATGRWPKSSLVSNPFENCGIHGQTTDDYVEDVFASSSHAAEDSVDHIMHFMDAYHNMSSDEIVRQRTWQGVVWSGVLPLRIPSTRVLIGQIMLPFMRRDP